MDRTVPKVERIQARGGKRRWKGYRLEEENETLADGTTLTTLVKVPASKD
jgi:hypothetical protein